MVYLTISVIVLFAGLFLLSALYWRDRRYRGEATQVSVDEQHYRSLIDLFKYAMTFLGVFGAVILYLTYKDSGAIRDEVRKNLTDAKSDIRQTMTDVKGDVKQSVDSTKSDAKQAIDYTKTFADTQISQTREQTSAIALNEARRQVDNAFRTSNIESMIELAAKKQVGQAYEREVRGQIDGLMDNIHQEITALGQINDAGAKMRVGIREGLERLQQLQRISQSEQSRQMAKALFEAITRDYETTVQKDFEGKSPLQFAYGDKAAEMKMSPTVISDAVKIILDKNMHLSPVAEQFFYLRDAASVPFKTFDFEAVEQWCKAHPAVCKIQ